MPRKVNIASGLPKTVNMKDEREVQRALNRLIDIVLTWNGEIGDPKDRLITAREYEE